MDYTLDPSVTTMTDYYYPDIFSSPCDVELIQTNDLLSAGSVGVWDCNVQSGVWLLLHWLLQQHVFHHPHECGQVPGCCPCCVCPKGEDDQDGHNAVPGSMANRHYGYHPIASVLPSGLG
ncbi:CCR8 isoform 1, partial [Pongo abelii]